MTSPCPPHRYELEVRFREVDAYGVVWHGHYFDWLETARHRFAAHFGFDTMAALGRGHRLPMLECRIEYRLPARFGDRIAIEVALDDDPRRVIAFRYVVTRNGEERPLALARTVQVVQGADDKMLLGWPDQITKLIERMRRYDAERLSPASGSTTQNRVP